MCIRDSVDRFLDIAGSLSVSNGHSIEIENLLPTFTGDIELDGGTIAGDSSIRFSGSVNVTTESVLRTNDFESFQEGVEVNLQADLHLQGNGTLIFESANFAGEGALINDPGNLLLYLEDGVLGVDLVNRGSLNNPILLDIFQLLINGNVENSGVINLQVEGTDPQLYDRLIVTNQFISNSGTFNIFIESDFKPLPGQQFDVLDFDSFVDNGVQFELQELWPGLEWDTSQFTTNGILRISGFLLGDVNQDGSVNLLDVAPFVELIQSGEYLAEADINQDGFVNLLDVSLFVELVTQGY